MTVTCIFCLGVNLDCVPEVDYIETYNKGIFVCSAICHQAVSYEK